MATIEQALAAVRASSSRTESIIADRAQLKSQLSAALANVKIPDDVQAEIDEIFDIETNDAKLIDEALNANVPPAAEVKPVADPGVGGNVAANVVKSTDDDSAKGSDFRATEPGNAASSGQPYETTQTGTSGSQTK